LLGKNTGGQHRTGRVWIKIEVIDQ